MYKLFTRMLCLLLCLLLPVSALAEPLPWLEPILNSRLEEEKEGSMAITAAADGAGVMRLIDFYMDYMEMQIQYLYGDMGWGDEETRDEVLRAFRTGYENTRKLASGYVPAACALAEHAELTAVYAGNEIHYELRVDGKPWFGFCLISQDDGLMYLTSEDLFPSYAVKIDVRQMYEEMGLRTEPGGSLAYRDQANAIAASVLNGEYNDFNLLESVLDAAGKGLGLLEQEGLARREDGTLVYEYAGSSKGGRRVKASRMEEMLKEQTVDMDPRLGQLLSAVFARQAENQESETEENGGSDIHQLVDRVEGLLAQATQRSTYSVRYALTGDELTVTGLRTEETGISLPESKENNAVGQWLQRFAGRDSRQESTLACKLTPASVELAMEENGVSSQLSLSAEENEIQAHYQAVYADEGTQVRAALLLTRDENGQQWEIAAAQPMYSYRTVNGETAVDYMDDPMEIRLGIGLDNRGENMEMALFTSMSGENALMTLFRKTGPGMDTPFEPVDLSALKESENESGFWKEIRTVAAPRLNRLILTGLPADARALMTPLLGAVTTLVSYAKEQE